MSKARMVWLSRKGARSRPDTEYVGKLRATPPRKRTSLRSEAAAEAPISAESATPNTPPERAKGGE
jgi:hypothetical protein